MHCEYMQGDQQIVNKERLFVHLLKVYQYNTFSALLVAQETLSFLAVALTEFYQLQR